MSNYVTFHILYSCDHWPIQKLTGSRSFALMAVWKTEWLIGWTSGTSMYQEEIKIMIFQKIILTQSVQADIGVAKFTNEIITTFVTSDVSLSVFSRLYNMLIVQCKCVLARSLCWRKSVNFSFILFQSFLLSYLSVGNWPSLVHISFFHIKILFLFNIYFIYIYIYTN